MQRFFLTIEPGATPDETAALYAVLATAQTIAPRASIANPSAWQAAARREAIVPFDASLGEPL